MLAASAGALEIVGQQLSDNSIIGANAFGALALHVDHELRGLVVGCGPMALLGLLGMGGGHKDYDARYEAHYNAHRVQNSVRHRPLLYLSDYTANSVVELRRPLIPFRQRGFRIHFQSERSLMSTSTKAMTSSTSVDTSRAFWERLWRTAGIQSIGCFIIAYIIYGSQPQVGASADALVAFYNGDRMRILIAAVFYGLAVLNLIWFAGAPQTPPAASSQNRSPRSPTPPHAPPPPAFSPSHA